MIKKYLEKIYLFLIFILLYAPILTLICLLYTSDAADEEDSVDLGGAGIVKKKKQTHNTQH